ncbi:transcriptional regulator NrdR [Spirochaeta dissipatitropha]
MDNRVIESRTLASGESIRRRRECSECSFRFTSYERIVEKQLMIVKKHNRREPFSREKLERGIHRALEKRDISQREIEEIVNDLEDKASLQGGSDHEISSSAIGEMVLEKLYHVDRVAYVRFASVYRNFSDLQEFIREIENFSRDIAE